jgi:phenylpropionate dioxygenase-like ring-hydroxylating dioxygenase large terminal subunit
MAEYQPYFLRNIWYYALPSAGLKAGSMKGKTFLGEPVLLARTKEGKAFALRDICPHRAMPLSCGLFDGKQVECCYHGWKFDEQGACREIPWLVGHEKIDPEKIKVRTYPLYEAQGNIWIFMGDEQGFEGATPPVIPGFGAKRAAQVYASSLFPCHMDHAVIGLMDPAHGPFVHQAWWWRKRTSIHEKAKAFGPSPFGFVMKKHTPSKNAFGYKILGGVPQTEIKFQLPGVRVEHTEVGKHHVVNLTCVTPIDETKTEIHHLIYWTQGWLNFLKPILLPFVHAFLKQDRDVVVRQQIGLKHEKSMMLLKDADTQARWYFQLKNEYAKAEAAGGSFDNPVPDVVLKWRS